jgi:hypothetical protein
MISDTCPSCKTSLIGEEVPGQPGLRYRLTVALYDPDRDRTVGWRCVACGFEWARGPA